MMTPTDTTVTDSAALIAQAKRKHKVTIRELAKRTGFPMTRVRLVLTQGVSDHYALRDWLQAITGTDPGNQEFRSVRYRKF